MFFLIYFMNERWSSEDSRSGSETLMDSVDDVVGQTGT